jgi:hypothetical protein
VGKNFLPQNPFISKVKKMYKFDGPDRNKIELINLEFFMDPDKPASKNSIYFVIFKDGCPEECIK